ncbi:hypothetical protein NDU88_007529 [Pleurodeles waltl]|uniref:Secreted protein n=1 Tax=Pleurodeles waltl TaxID=8319 RepID=A0AAV7MKI2_PLEWA|nr:hypothetical protein NDU88_007529 [Pleurodeles waltl]
MCPVRAACVYAQRMRKRCVQFIWPVFMLSMRGSGVPSSCSMCLCSAHEEALCPVRAACVYAQRMRKRFLLSQKIGTEFFPLVLFSDEGAATCIPTRGWYPAALSFL